MNLDVQRACAIEAVLRASKVCTRVQNELLSEGTHTKADASPVTVADYAAQAIVNHLLSEQTTDFAIVAEEESGALRQPTNHALRRAVINAVQSSLPTLSDISAIDAIDIGQCDGLDRSMYWTLDPIDGTKGFLRRDQYAVALALIVDGQVELGVLGCPNLPLDPNGPHGERGCLFIASRGKGTVVRGLTSAAERPIRVSNITDPSHARLCESVEKAHSSQSQSAQVAKLLGIEHEPHRIDSQCKYGAVARGEASIYLRLPTRKDYIEKIWDHAAGVCVIEEAGGMVSDIHGSPLDFSCGRLLENNTGVIVTNKHLHAAVVESVGCVLGL